MRKSSIGSVLKVVARIALYSAPSHTTREWLFMGILLRGFEKAWPLLEEGRELGPYGDR